MLFCLSDPLKFSFFINSESQIFYWFLEVSLMFICHIVIYFICLCSHRISQVRNCWSFQSIEKIWKSWNHFGGKKSVDICSLGHSRERSQSRQNTKIGQKKLVYAKNRQDVVYRWSISIQKWNQRKICSKSTCSKCWLGYSCSQVLMSKKHPLGKKSQSRKLIRSLRSR